MENKTRSLKKVFRKFTEPSRVFDHDPIMFAYNSSIQGRRNLRQESAEKVSINKFPFHKIFSPLNNNIWKTGFPSCLPEKPAAPLDRFFLRFLLDERKGESIYSESSMSCPQIKIRIVEKLETLIVLVET